MWFAGNHSDVGGSYPESETRLSDISLGWMAHAFQTFPDRKEPDGFGIKVHDFPPTHESAVRLWLHAQRPKRT
ncbi:hypothetical protein GPL21_33845 [Bradyrhizobium pachyrhizi]|uniref:T6SS Phospholipase effector Tle1-like catalytic domain-containing protein n=1 Tax=Bradyrhizobium pachyrhizi TaxID=280333 RepID=A0A844T139_9BRAD|nr:hypothetical protein [Bradyrhizobium pachyrhizi]